jgi:hypothetical protein
MSPELYFPRPWRRKAQLESLAAAVVGDMSVSQSQASFSSNKKIDRRHQSENEV